MKKSLLLSILIAFCTLQNAAKANQPAIQPISQPAIQPTTQSSSESFAVIQDAAVQQDKIAQRILGLMYANGEGIAQDTEQAKIWLEKSANQGDMAAQYYLGVMYSNGDVLAQNTPTAIKWFEKAAQQGSVQAQNNLGYIYGQGLGIEADSAKAMSWLEKAASAGDKQAQYNLGVLYSQATTIKNNNAQAISWFEKAAQQEYAPAQDLLKKLNAIDKNATDLPMTDTVSGKQTLPAVLPIQPQQLLKPDYAVSNKQPILVANKNIIDNKSTTDVKASNALPVTKIIQQKGLSSVLSGQNQNHYTLQLSSSLDPKSVQKIVAQYNLSDYIIYQTTRKGRDWYILVMGDYTNEQQAKQAITQLPKALKNSSPWIRRWQQVSKDL